MINSSYLLLLFIIYTIYFCSVSSSDIQPDNFDSDVVNDPKVWLVEFYSGMCGSCKEFSPVWNKLESSLKGSLLMGKINIDNKKGLVIAEKVGALEEGIPHLRFFINSGDALGFSLGIRTIYYNIVNFYY